MNEPARLDAREVAIEAHQAGNPSREQEPLGRDTAGDGGDPAEAARVALEEIQQRPDRDATTGRFVVGNQAAGSTLARSEALWSAVEPAKQALVERLKTDLAVDGATAATLEGLITAYSEARLLRHAMFTRLVELGGPITTKGKARALFSAYLSALDREVKLATTLGLERRSKPTPSLAQTLADRGESEAAP